MSIEKYLEAMDKVKNFSDVVYERTLTDKEKDKREEIAKAIERENPDMDMSKKMAIATAQAKKVSESIEQIDEAGTQHPLPGHDYHRKTDAELRFIQKDAKEAEDAMSGHNPKAANKYADQKNDASTVLHFRKKGMPDWYKKKYGHIKEETEINEISLGAKIRAHAQRKRAGFEGDNIDDYNKADKIRDNILKKHGETAAKYADDAADTAIWGREHKKGSDSLSGGLRDGLSKDTKKDGKIKKSTQVGMKHAAKSGRISGPKGRLPEEIELDDSIIESYEELDAKEKRKDKIRQFIKNQSAVKIKRTPGKPEVKEETELDEALKGGEKAAYDVGFAHGRKNSPKIDANKSFGSYDKHYHDGYHAGKSSAETEDWHEEQKSKRLRKEELEQIEELSDKTLDSYQEKSKKEIDDKIKSGDFKGVTKRNKGMISSIVAKHRNSLKSLTKEDIDESYRSHNKPLGIEYGMGDGRTPKEMKDQIRNLSDDTLKKWYSSKKNFLDSIEKKMQDKLIASEMRRRGLIEELELDENKYSSGGEGPSYTNVGTKVKIHTSHKNAGKTGTVKKIDYNPVSGKTYHVEHEDGTHETYGREHVRRV